MSALERSMEALTTPVEVPPGQVDYGPGYGVSNYPETHQPAGGKRPIIQREPRRIPTLPRSVCVETGRQSLTVGELRQLLDQLPDEVEIRADSLPVKVAAHYGNLLLLDTCTGLPDRCVGCGEHDCDGRCA